DLIAQQLDLDPGVLCSRDRLEAVARAQPSTVDALLDVPGMRRWQVDVLGTALLRALRVGAAKPSAPAKANGADDSPYRDS
nr:HRDC domain-containing protein [Gemmatimonadaceae bacterium]